jgi:hypothetical protein
MHGESADCEFPQKDKAEKRKDEGESGSQTLHCYRRLRVNLYQGIHGISKHSSAQKISGEIRDPQRLLSAFIAR